MSEQIDWSKAPEGATHYSGANEMFYVFLGSLNGRYWSESRKDWLVAGYIEEYNCMIPRQATATTPSWLGEGVPPVGVVCEALYMGQPQGVVTVRYSGQCMILWSEDRMSEQCGQADHYFFKPIRTQEQIAADAR